MSKQHKVQRARQWKQRVALLCDEVWRVASALHTQGIYPSQERVASYLSTPSMIRNPVVRAAWHAVLRELGFEK